LSPGCKNGPGSLFGDAMLRISLAYLYDAGAAFSRLIDVTSKPGDITVDEVWIPATQVFDRLIAIYGNSFYKDSLIVSRPFAETLVEYVQPFRARTDFTAVLLFTESYNIRSAATKFEDVFRAELAVIDTYFVTKKGGYDTLKLVTEGSILFPKSLSAKVPEAVADTNEAGKCIAFELGTAAGFHILRAAESVLRRYWGVVAKGNPRPRNHNIGAYLHAFEKFGVGHPKILAALKQIKDLHRNTLMHPEDVLTVDEAISLLGIVRSAIEAMLSHLPDVAAPALPAPVIPPSPALPAP
jgi:hypothetical protein